MPARIECYQSVFIFIESQGSENRSIPLIAYVLFPKNKAIGRYSEKPEMEIQQDPPSLKYSLFLFIKKKISLLKSGWGVEGV